MESIPEQASRENTRAGGGDAPSSGNSRVAAFSCGILVALALAAAALFAWALAEDAAAPAQQPGGTVRDAPAESGLPVDARSAPLLETPDLPALLGKTVDRAMQDVGHGAQVRAEVPAGMRHADDTEVAIALTEVRSKDGPGAPTVFLATDGGGTVVSARYSAALRFYGFGGSLPFRKALDEARVVDAALADMGLERVSGAARCPDDPASYRVYGDDGRTLASEHADFGGTALSGDARVRWWACLDYDYAKANETGNLVFTRRVLSVGVAGA